MWKILPFRDIPGPELLTSPLFKSKTTSNALQPRDVTEMTCCCFKPKESAKTHYVTVLVVNDAEVVGVFVAEDPRDDDVMEFLENRRETRVRLWVHPLPQVGRHPWRHVTHDVHLRAQQSNRVGQWQLCMELTFGF